MEQLHSHQVIGTRSGICRHTTWSISGWQSRPGSSNTVGSRCAVPAPAPLRYLSVKIGAGVKGADENQVLKLRACNETLTCTDRCSSSQRPIVNRSRHPRVARHWRPRLDAPDASRLRPRGLLRWTHEARARRSRRDQILQRVAGFIGQLAQAAMQRGDAVLFLRIVDQIVRLARVGPQVVQLAEIAVEIDRELVIACSQGAPGRNRRSRCGCRAGRGGSGRKT